MTCFANRIPDDEFEYGPQIPASSDLPSTPNAKTQTQDAGLLIYTLSDVGAINIADLCSNFQRVVSMLWACCGHADDMVPTVSCQKGPRQPPCRRHVGPTCRRRVTCRHFQDFLPTRHGQHILLSLEVLTLEVEA